MIAQAEENSWSELLIPSCGQKTSPLDHADSNRTSGPANSIFCRNGCSKPTRIDTGSRSVRTVESFLLIARTTVQSPSVKGSETNSKCSPYILMRLDAMKPRSLALAQFSEADRPLVWILRAPVDTGRICSAIESTLGRIKHSPEQLLSSS
jgi:hypothetical protein